MSSFRTSRPFNRVSTGINGLDDLVEGGLPTGSLILLAGSPGAGKTIASSQFLYHGANVLGENGIYVSFAERKDAFLDNMARFGFDFEDLEKKGKFRFLDLMTANEKVISSTLDFMVSEVLHFRPKRLVVDSFSAMAQAFDRKIDARVVLHTMHRLMRQTGCTTLLLLEFPTGSQTLGLEFEEFVSDGIILFETVSEKEGIRKRAVILKMRGTNHNQNYCSIVFSDRGISLAPYVT